MSSSKSLVLLFTLLDPISRFLFLPWGVKYISVIYEGSWAGTVSSYGLLTSTMVLGRVLGKTINVPKLDVRRQVSFTNFVIKQTSTICFAYLLLCMTNRFTLLLASFFVLGFAGGRISTLHEVDEQQQLSPSSSKLGTEEVNSNMISSASTLAFTCLLSGIAYNPSFKVRFPSWKPVMILCVTSTLLSIAFIIQSRSYLWLVNKCSCVSRITRIGVGREGSSSASRSYLQKDGEESASLLGNSQNSSNGGDKNYTTRSRSNSINYSRNKYSSNGIIETINIPQGIEVPEDFKAFNNGNEEKARAQYVDALKWRHNHSLDDILDEAQPHFHDVMELYPHSIHGKSKDNCVVLYENIGRSNPTEIVSRGITPSMMAWHFVLRNEYVFRCLNVDPPVMHNASGILDPISGYTDSIDGDDSGQSVPNKSNNSRIPRASIHDINNNGNIINVDINDSDANPSLSSPTSSQKVNSNCNSRNNSNHNSPTKGNIIKNMSAPTTPDGTSIRTNFMSSRSRRNENVWHSSDSSSDSSYDTADEGYLLYGHDPLEEGALEFDYDQAEARSTAMHNNNNNNNNDDSRGNSSGTPIKSNSNRLYDNQGSDFIPALDVDVDTEDALVDIEQMEGLAHSPKQLSSLYRDKTNTSDYTNAIHSPDDPLNVKWWRSTNNNNNNNNKFVDTAHDIDNTDGMNNTTINTDDIQVEDYYGIFPRQTNDLWGQGMHYPQMNIMTVLDVKGISLSQITAETISFIKQSAEIMDSYYPGRVRRLIVCNAPRFFWTVWSTISVVLPESVRQKIIILNDTDGLDEYIHPSQRPVEYGGTDIRPLGEAPEFLAFKDLYRVWQERGAISTRSKKGKSLKGIEGAEIGVVGEPGSIKLNSKNHNDNTTYRHRYNDRDNDKYREWRPDGLNVDVEKGLNGRDIEIDGNEAPSGKSKSPGGWFGWLFGQNARGTPRAYLGERNTYRFDASSSSWVPNAQGTEEHDIDSGGLSSSSTRSRTFTAEGGLHIDEERSNQELLDEHKLVLAIQAAHIAQGNMRESSSYNDLSDHSHLSLSRTSSRDSRDHHTGFASYGLRGPGSAFSGHSFGGSSSLYSYSKHNSSHNNADDGYNSDRSDYTERSGSIFSNNTTSNTTRTPAHTFLLVTWMFTSCVLLQAGVMVLIPVWMVTSQDRGGLGYTCTDTGLVLSACGIWLLHANHYLKPRLAFVTRASPLRALRVACGGVLIVSLLLPLLLSKGAGEEAEVAVLSGHYHKDAPEGFFQELYPRPASSPFAIVMPSFLFSALATALLLARRAAGILLGTCAQSSFTSSSEVVALVGSHMDIVGPVLAGLIFSNGYRKELAYPLDSSMFLLLSACMSGLLYIASMLLSIHFIGDFGIMTDEAVASMQARDAQELVVQLKHFFSMPMQDCGLLFNPATAGYDARMYNLKEV